MTRLHLLTAIALLSLAACNRAGHANNAQGAGAANAAATSAGSVEATGSGEETATPRVLLTGDGVLADGTNASMVRFGAGRADAMAAVARTLGQARGLNAVEDCGGSGPAQQADYGALVLFFQNDRFVGWEQREASENPYLGTPGGAAVGLRRPDLAGALAVAPSVEQSSLGTEFSGGGVSGLLASDRPDAQVDRLWAGSNCAMR